MMLARNKRQLLRVSGPTSARAVPPLQFLGRQAQRGILIPSLNHGILPADSIFKVLAANNVVRMKLWEPTHLQFRSISTETRPPDPQPFPLPTQKPQQSNARAPPLPIPPQVPRTEPLKLPELGQTVSADSPKATPATVIPTAADAKITTAPVENKSKSEDKPEKSEKKLTIWQRVKNEAVHYWDGTKLLGKEIEISFRLALKMAAGYELSRRENRQLKRTTQDLIRLVPFSVFVIVPFAEFLLPVALKLFPNMLPSTYEEESAKEAKRAALVKTRKDVSNFLRTTIQESGLYVRTSGECPSDEDVIEISKIFRDDLTLDNLSRAQLMAMCRYMGLNTFGTDALLRYHLRHHLRQIKRDDKAISFEGVTSLSVPELQYATAARGIRTVGVSPARLRDNLQQWLDLRLKHGIPSTLLVLSNAYAYGQDDNPKSHIDNLRTTLSCLTDELFHEAELEVHNAEGAATNKQRLEVIQEQEELIEDENKQEESAKMTTGTETKVKDDVDLDEKEEAKLADAETDPSTETVVEEEQIEGNGPKQENQKVEDTKK